MVDGGWWMVRIRRHYGPRIQYQRVRGRAKGGIKKMASERQRWTMAGHQGYQHSGPKRSTSFAAHASPGVEPSRKCGSCGMFGGKSRLALSTLATRMTSGSGPVCAWGLGPVAAIDRRPWLDTVLVVFTAAGNYRSALCSIRVSELVCLRFGPPSAPGILVAPRICRLTTEEANLDIQLHIACRSKEHEA